MDAWSDIRLIARECRAAAVARAGGAQDARAVIGGMIALHDLELEPYDPGTRAQANVLGFFERRFGIIHVARGQRSEDEVVVIAHELGHFRLHTDVEAIVTDVGMRLSGSPVDSGAARVDGYSSRERKEVQADVFAGEFLCPTDWLAERLENGDKPSAIAAELGLPYGLVLQQTIRARMLPPLAPPADGAARATLYTLDDDQRAVVDWDDGPLLVQAGPGTGKTRALVERIRRILDHDGPASILALTFSNKAAEELRERLSLIDQDAAVEMWVGTFHAFGLELVTRYARRIGRTDDVKVFDPTASLALLENNLERLPLRHFQNLFEPAFDLAPVLTAISRCKDELIGTDDYLAAATEALSAAGEDEAAIEAAEKAVEIAGIYKVYEDLLREADAVDFGDLIVHAAVLLDDPEVRQDHIGRFRHILVDEYQDVNFASSALLQKFARDCRDLWVVADHRQSIYRFRGAEPANVARFVPEFGGRALALRTNYRSGSPVIRAFATFARSIDGRAAADWSADRGDIGEVTLEACETLDDEACAIRDHIEDLRNRGVRYQHQAILARSHLTLARLTELLERLNVPLLYLGDLFEREEIRDLLSLVAIDAEFGGVGLVRVAQLPEYGAAASDALAVLSFARENDVAVIAALGRLDEIDGLTEPGRAGLTRLSAQLAGFGPATTPWGMLTRWLFDTSAYLAPLLNATDLAARQKLIAIYHLLKVCSEHDASGDRSRRGLLARIRRIEALNQDTAYRTVSAEATDIDAVRVLTIHGSKGLEFSAVHLPGLATRYMPAGRRGSRIPDLAGFPQLTMSKEDHDAEEECLFFVGLSRARDHLCLTRAERYTTQRASPSKFLGVLSPTVRERRRSGPGMLPPRPADSSVDVRAREHYDAAELETYDRCPARYRYEWLFGLHGGSETSAFLSFHRSVRRTLVWLQERKAEGRSASRAEALERLATEWAERGPVGHGFERYYQLAAERMVANAAKSVDIEIGDYVDEPLEVRIAGRTVIVEPDKMLVADGSVRVQRIRTGKRTKSEAGKPIYALLRRGAQNRYPSASVSVEAYYPDDGVTLPIPIADDAKALRAYEDAIAGIESGAFPAKPKDARFCPNCSCYFICGV